MKVISVPALSRVSIFVRKTLHIRLRDRKMCSILLARREGYAFFDEDDTLLPGL